MIRNERADKPGSVEDSHSSGPNVAVGLKQPTRVRRGQRHSTPIRSCSRWGLPCHAALAPHAVRSYRTISPLPVHSRHTRCRAHRACHRRFAFCCTFRRLTPPRRYLAPCPVEPGLSSPVDRFTPVAQAPSTERPIRSDCLARSGSMVPALGSVPRLNLNARAKMRRAFRSGS